MRETFYTLLSAWLAAFLLYTLFLLPALAIDSVLDQQQTAGGNSFGFYRDSGNTHKWAGQQFQPTKPKITSVDLRFRMNYDSSTACRGALNKIDVEIKESTNNGNDMGDTVAYVYDFDDICYLPPRTFTWRSIPLTQIKDLDTSKKYWIAVNYWGGQTGFSALDWEKATYDANPALRYKIPGSIMGDYDFTFKTYGYMPPCYNSASWQCKDSQTYGYLNGNCDWESLQSCTATQHCENTNGCVDNTNLDITTSEVTDASTTAQRSFNNGDTINLVSTVQNRGAYGPFSLLFEVLQGSSVVHSKTWSTTYLNNGESMRFTDTQAIPSDWSGSYTFRTTSPTCFSPSQCTQTVDFTVSVPCTDSDGDGYFMNCGTLDCNDNNANAHPGLTESCSDNVDNDCNGAVDEVCEPSLILEGIWSLHENNSVDTSFQRNENIKFGVQFRNNGATGPYAYTLVIKKGWNEVHRISNDGTITGNYVTVAYPYFFIPDNWQGEYTYDVEVSPCQPSAATICTMSKSFTVDVPVLNLEGIWTLTEDNTVTEAFQQNQNMKFGIQFHNSGPAGEYSSTLDVYSGSFHVHHDDSSGTINAGTTKVLYHYFFIPDNWAGVYHYNATISPCTAPQSCVMSKTFSVGDDCIDGDHDGFCANEGQVDCNDSVSTTNAGASEACDGIDNNCDGVRDEGFYVLNDSLNCGGCGIICAEGEICSSGVCTSSTGEGNTTTIGDIDNINFSPINGKYVLLPMDAFVHVATYLALNGITNTIFFTNETEANASKMLLANAASLASGVSDALSVAKYVLLDPLQMKTLIDNKILSNAMRGKELNMVIKYADGVDEVVYLETEASRKALAKADYLIYKSDKFLKNDLKTYKTYLTGALVVYSTLNATGGKVNDQFAVLLPSYAILATSTFPPYVAVKVIKIVKDVVGGIGSYAFTIIGFDPEKVTCNLQPYPADAPQDTASMSVYYRTLANDCNLVIAKTLWDFVGGVLDAVADADPKEAFYGSCGLFNGKVVTCVSSISEGITLLWHPIPVILETTTSQYGRTVAFQERVKDHNPFNSPERDVWIGASVLTKDTLGCNYDLPPQEVHFDYGEEKKVYFEWEASSMYPRETNTTFVSQVWHSCVDCSNKDAYCQGCAYTGDGALCNACIQCGAPLPYTQCNPGNANNFRCSVDNFTHLNYALSGAAINFTIENHPPIINNIKLNGLSYGSLVYENENVTLDVYVTDMDDDKIIVNYEAPTSGLLAFVSCLPADPYDMVCRFTWKPGRGSAGNYTIMFTVDDWYDITRQPITLSVRPIACYSNYDCGGVATSPRTCTPDKKAVTWTTTRNACYRPGTPSSQCVVLRPVTQKIPCRYGCSDGICKRKTLLSGFSRLFDR